MPIVGLNFYYSPDLMLHSCFLQLNFKQFKSQDKFALFFFPQINITKLSFTQWASSVKSSKAHCLFFQSSLFCFVASSFLELFPGTDGWGCSFFWVLFTAQEDRIRYTSCLQLHLFWFLTRDKLLKNIDPLSLDTPYRASLRRNVLSHQNMFWTMTQRNCSPGWKGK